jgi:phosphocarrier protein
MKEFNYTIKDAVGIHARPAGQLVKLAKGLDSTITITKADKTVNVTQLMKLMGMGIKCGDTVNFKIEGGDEEASAKAIQDFMNANL